MDPGGRSEADRLYPKTWLWELENTSKECRYVISSWFEPVVFEDFNDVRLFTGFCIVELLVCVASFADFCV